MKSFAPTTTSVIEENPIEIKNLIDAIKTKELKQVQEYVNANGNECVFQNDKDGFSPMHWAAINGNLEVVKYLIELKANPLDCYNERLQKPIHWAATKGHVDIINLLLYYGENVNIRDQKGYTPLITSAQYGHIPLCSFLIGRGSNLEIEDLNGDNAMHWAAYKGYSELVSLLIYFGLNPQRQDNFGQTALHLAAISGSLPTVKLLSDLIDVNTRDNNNNTPLSIAKGRGYHDAFEYLERQKLYKFSRKFDIRTLIFGPVDNTKGMFIFCHIVVLCFQYPFYFYHIFPRTYSDYEVLHQIYWFFCILYWITFYACHWVDPGYLKKNSEDYKRAIKLMTQQGSDRTFDELNKRNSRLCHTCKIVRPYRSSHCKACNRCVLAYDHHCPYIQTCVGYKNRTWFFAFGITVADIAFTNLFLCYLILSETPDLYSLYWGAFLTACFSILSVFVISFQIHNMVRNLTTNEAAKTKKYDYLRDSRGKFKNVFSKGLIYNIKHYFHLVEPSYLETSSFEYNTDYNI